MTNFDRQTNADATMAAAIRTLMAADPLRRLTTAGGRWERGLNIYHEFHKQFEAEKIRREIAGVDQLYCLLTWNSL